MNHESVTVDTVFHSRACAKLRAQSRRYEAVLEMQPRQYSMVWMAWCINTSAVSNTCQVAQFHIYTGTTKPHVWPQWLIQSQTLTFSTSSSSAVPSSTSPWRVLILPSSVISGRLPSSWHHRKPEIRQNPEPTGGQGWVDIKHRPHDESVSSCMSHIYIWASPAGGPGQTTRPGPPGPSAQYSKWTTQITVKAPRWFEFGTDVNALKSLN